MLEVLILTPGHSNVLSADASAHQTYPEAFTTAVQRYGVLHGVPVSQFEFTVTLLGFGVSGGHERRQYVGYSDWTLDPETENVVGQVTYTVHNTEDYALVFETSVDVELL
jgi:hypothetical protein